MGAGYVGLATGIGLAALGHRIELVDVRSDRIDALRAGRVPIHEPGLRGAFADAGIRDRISILAAPGETPVDAVLVCVGTPMESDGRADLRQIESALRDARHHLAAGSILVIRSTLPVGSIDRVVDWSQAPRSRIFTNPEFLRQGQALEDFLHPTRIVIGSFPEADATSLARVEAMLRVDPAAPFLVVGIAEADLIKNGANAFLALKLSFINEMAALCESLGADIDTVAHGIGLDPRIGPRYLQAGFGFGGSCLPKELATLASAGRDRGLTMHVTAAAADANASHQQRFADRIVVELGDPRGKKVAMLGLAFKAGTDDVRASPALRVAELLMQTGAEVMAHDPLAGPAALQALPGLMIAQTPETALHGAHLAVITTEWPEYRELDWARIRDAMLEPVVVDGRRLLRGTKLTSLGFRYLTIGSPPTNDSATSA